MNSYRSPGETIPLANTTTNALTPDTVVEIVTGNAGFIGVTVDTVPASGNGVVRVQGIVNLTAFHAAWTAGAKLYWNGTGLTATAGTLTYAGRAVAAKATNVLTGDVRLGVA
jgi:predicted RecA/RadA family phage recombinase